MEFYQTRVIIAYFVGGRQSTQVINEWASVLATELKDECRIGRDLGQGFFQVVTKQEAMTQKALMLTPHISKWGTCIMQPWIPDFNPTKPEGMKMPVWITLKNVRDEMRSSAPELAASLGTILGKHQGNQYNLDQKFCIAITTGKPLDLTIEAVNPITKGTTVIQVDYNNLPIRCRFCLSTSHLIKDCSVFHRNRKSALEGKKSQEDTKSTVNTTRGPEKEGGVQPQQPGGSEIAQQGQVNEGAGCRQEQRGAATDGEQSVPVGNDTTGSVGLNQRDKSQGFPGASSVQGRELCRSLDAHMEAAIAAVAATALGEGQRPGIACQHEVPVIHSAANEEENQSRLSRSLSSGSLKDIAAHTIVDISKLPDTLVEQRSPNRIQGSPSRVQGVQEHDAPTTSCPSLDLNKRHMQDPNSASNAEDEDLLSLSIDHQGQSEGRRIPAHLAAVVRDWLRDQGEYNIALPMSPHIRISSKTTEKRNQSGPQRRSDRLAGMQ
jgi:hypothetical protein